MTIDDLGYGDDGISHVTARFGFQDDIDVPSLLTLAVAAGLECDCEPTRASYFLSRMTIVPTAAPDVELAQATVLPSATTPPTRSTTSGCPTIARSSWART